jgi:peptidoglycan/xylan/chitin deacetylase (PgdA/CDA1 family)
MFFLKSTFYIFTSTLLFTLFVENKPEVCITTYKNDAAGAYTLIHDDFGGSWADGIGNYADTMAFNRKIPLCVALIAGHCDNNDWLKAIAMTQHGHQLLNHSMNHLCGSKGGGCSPGVKMWDENNFGTEIDSSEALIIRNTGKHPLFFMFPFDVHTDTMISYLRHKGYAGARAGQRDLLTESNPSDPFYLNFKAFLPGQTSEDLNSFADEAITGNGWAIREVHGVEDGSWGTINLNDYRIHLDYIKALSDSGKLWVATLSDVLLYRYNAGKYKAAISQTDKNGRISTIKIRKKLDEDGYVAARIYKSLKKYYPENTVTIAVQNMTDIPSEIKQNGKSIKWVIRENKLVAEAVPDGGEITFQY